MGAGYQVGRAVWAQGDASGMPVAPSTGTGLSAQASVNAVDHASLEMVN